MLMVLVVAFVFAAVASIIAHGKGRNSLGWFIAGLLIGPFALVVAFLRPVVREGQYKGCPACAEVIMEEAHRCRHCGFNFEKVVENGT